MSRLHSKFIPGEVPRKVQRRSNPSVRIHPSFISGGPSLRALPERGEVYLGRVQTETLGDVYKTPAEESRGEEIRCRVTMRFPCCSTGSGSGQKWWGLLIYRYNAHITFPPFLPSLAAPCLTARVAAKLNRYFTVSYPHRLHDPRVSGRRGKGGPRRRRRRRRPRVPIARPPARGV